MTRVTWHLETGMQGGDLTGEIEVEDDASTEEIDAAVREDMWGFLLLTWNAEPLT